MGGSDLVSVYSYDDFDGDTCLNDFTLDYAPDHVFEVLGDIKSINRSKQMALF